MLKRREEKILCGIKLLSWYWSLPLSFCRPSLIVFYVSCLDDCKRKRLRILNNFCFNISLSAFNILLYENLDGSILDKTYFQMLKMIIAFVIQYYQHRFYLNNLLYKLKLELSKYELVIWICICYLLQMTVNRYWRLIIFFCCTN